MSKTRKLQFENLESRQLLSTDLWPKGVGLKADVFVDGGVELSKVSLAKSANLAGLTREVFFTNSGATTRAVIGGNANDTNGALLFPDGQPRFGTIYVNGGSAGHAKIMGAAGRQAIETFYAHGGSYTGSCAGEFVAARRIPSLWGGKVGNQGNTGRQTITFDETDHPLVQDLMRWNGGSNVVTNVPHYWGPTNRESYPHPEGTLFLGTITGGLYRGTDFLVEYQRDAESGVTVLSPSHPEYGRQASHTALMASILKRANDLSRTTPDLKGTLVSDQSLEMSGPEQKVGDGQYHRYTLEVPEGTSVLYVGLTNLSGNADLFIQKDGVAHAGSYLVKSTNVGDDMVAIPSPEAGTYEISVFGAHTVLNGAAYTLSVKAQAVDMVLAEAEMNMSDEVKVEGPYTFGLTPGSKLEVQTIEGQEIDRLRVEMDQLQKKLDEANKLLAASMRLLKNRDYYWSWNYKLEQYGYFSQGEYVGTELLDVVKLEARLANERASNSNAS
jgi:hypothetical protein